MGTKIINAWSATTKGVRTNPGDLILIQTVDGERQTQIITDYLWHFFVQKSKKSEEVLETMFKQHHIKSYHVGRYYIKVSMEKRLFRDPNVVKLVQYLEGIGIKTYEADVGPAKRYMIDRGLEIEDFDKINLMYIDIETDDSHGNIEYESKNGFSSINAKDRILSIACVDRKGKEFFFYHTDEKTLLQMFNKFVSLEQVDMFVGWNSKDFDMPYLYKRMEKHKLNSTYMRNVLHEDMMKRVMYFYMKDPEARQNITSYSLNSIANYFLGEGKIERDGKIIDLIKDDFEKFKAYNIKDAQLLRQLEDKLGLINLTYQMFQMCGCTAQNWSMVKAIDNFLLIEGQKSSVHYPTNLNFFNEVEESDEEYLGAYVLDPVPGYYENVYDLDFKSLYPNIIRTFNISPETLCPRIGGMDLIETPGVEIEGKVRGKSYYEKKEGIVPRKIKLLLDEREKIRVEQRKLSKDSVEYRDLNVKQLVVKELANSIYGVIGNRYFRCFDLDVAESITATGQYLIKYLKRTFEEKGRKVIYGDTDSVFVILAEGEQIETVLTETNLELRRHLVSNFGVMGESVSIELALDKQFDKYLIEGKKKYVGRIGSKVSYTGMECIKRDCIPVAASYQKKLIDQIFNHADKSSVLKWIEEKKENISKEHYKVEDITIHKKMAKDASLYKGKGEKKYTAPLHVRIAQRIKRKGDKTDLSKGGSIISYYVIPSTDGKNLEGKHISEYKEDWDREYYWNKIIYPPMKRILEVIYPEVDWNEYVISAVKKNDRIKLNRSDGNKVKRKTRSSNIQGSGKES